jgi:hypothetical protein
MVEDHAGNADPAAAAAPNILATKTKPPLRKE